MDVVPGIKAKVVKGDLDEVFAEQAKIATRQVTHEEGVERRKTEIRETVCKTLREMRSVNIDDEMRELGMEDEVWKLIQQAELALPFMRAMSSAEDADVDPGVPERWID